MERTHNNKINVKLIWKKIELKAYSAANGNEKL